MEVHLEGVGSGSTGVVAGLNRNRASLFTHSQDGDMLEFERSNKEQLSTLRLFFTGIDVDGDGVISTEDFQSAMQNAIERVLESRTSLDIFTDDLDEEQVKLEFREFWSRLDNEGEADEITWEDILIFCMEQPEQLPDILKPMGLVDDTNVERACLESMGMRSLLDDMVSLMDDLLAGMSVSSKRVERLREEMLTSNIADMAQPRMDHLDDYLAKKSRYGENVSDFVLGWQGNAVVINSENKEETKEDDDAAENKGVETLRARRGFRAYAKQIQFLARMKFLMGSPESRTFTPKWQEASPMQLLGASTASDEPPELSASLKSVLPGAVLSGGGVGRLAMLLDQAANGWMMDAWELTALTAGQPLSTMVVHLLDFHGLMYYYALDVKKVHRYFREVEEATPNNPYHNRTHLADVTQALHTLIMLGGLGRFFTEPVDLLAAIFAAAIHDFGHPGASQDYLVKTNNRLALRYNDRTVLENMHLAGAFKLLGDRPEVNWLKGKLDADNFAQMRNLMIEMVLATDMKLHFDHVNQLQRLAKREADVPPASRRVSTTIDPTFRTPGASMNAELSGGVAPGTSSPGGPGSPRPDGMGGSPATGDAFPGGGGRRGRGSIGGLTGNMGKSMRRRGSMIVAPRAPGQPTTAGGGGFGQMAEMDPAKRMLLVARLGIKCADLMHTTRLFDIHMKWSLANEEESWRVGDQFKALGHKVVPMMDRNSEDMSLGKAQIGFFDVICRPMFRGWTKIFPASQPVLARLDENYARWDKILAEGGGGSGGKKGGGG